MKICLEFKREMKKNLHPMCEKVFVFCNCGNKFFIMSVLSQKELKVDVCSQCHQFYTGKQKIIDSAGMVEIFNRRFKR